MRDAVWLWGPVIGLMGLVFWLSAQSTLPAPPGPLSDKQVHAVTYGALAALTLRALARARWSGVTPARAAAAVLVAVFYGVTDEWHQSFVAGRTPELGDVYANTIGAVTAAGLLWACGIITARRRRQRIDTSR